ncbi:MAG: helix-turn-helix transcriptional regulator [Fusobacteria bacterium]|nr:helix-turn-helix transcriptional regulator [Fusobacteriota bacterium]
MDLNRATLIMKMMSNEIRLNILRMLYKSEGDVYVNNIESTLNISQSTVSQHLSHLRNSSIVACDKKGKNVAYKIIDKDTKNILKYVDDRLKIDNIKVS